jgi:hypothetical protein
MSSAKEVRDQAMARSKEFWTEYNSAPYPTYQQLGDKHGITRERVRQLIKRWEDTL